MPAQCSVRYAPECNTKGFEKVAPDGAEVAGLKHRAKVSDEGAAAVVGLEGSSNRGEVGEGGVVDTNAGEGSVWEG